MTGLADHAIGAEDDLAVAGLAALEAAIAPELAAEHRIGERPRLRVAVRCGELVEGRDGSGG